MAARYNASDTSVKLMIGMLVTRNSVFLKKISTQNIVAGETAAQWVARHRADLEAKLGPSIDANEQEMASILNDPSYQGVFFQAVKNYATVKTLYDTVFVTTGFYTGSDTHPDEGTSRAFFKKAVGI